MTNAREARFVEEYVACLNATQAAIRAGYSKRTAKQQASRLLTRQHVAAAVQEAQERHAAKVDVKADEVIRELKVMAFARDDIRDGDKLKALELLGRHLKMFTDKVEQAGPSFAELVLEAQRLREDRDRKAAAAPAAGPSTPEAPRPAGTQGDAPTPAVAGSEPEIEAQPDPEPGRFNPLQYLRGGAA